jgi:hypothetical protein
MAYNSDFLGGPLWFGSHGKQRLWTLDSTDTLATIVGAINGVAVTGGVLTIAEADSAAGDIDTATPSAANTGAAGALITATVGGASTATETLNVFALIERTA